jgi:hypothetical protein
MKSSHKYHFLYKAANLVNILNLYMHQSIRKSEYYKYTSGYQRFMLAKVIGEKINIIIFFNTFAALYGCIINNYKKNVKNS